MQAPLVRSDPAAPLLTIQGGTNGVLVDDTLRINGVLAPEASLPFLSLSGGTSGVQVLKPAAGADRGGAHQRHRRGGGAECRGDGRGFFAAGRQQPAAWSS